MVIGRLSFGKRMYFTNKFRFFYCPLLKENRKKHFWFFWWIGKRWYIAMHKYPKEAV